MKLKPKRAYRSSRRKEQAQGTRIRILESAKNLFIAKGFESTSIEAIAREAGVSPETIYAAFKNKLNLLSKLVGFSIVGDEEPTPLLEREVVLSSRLEKNSDRLLQKWAADIHARMTRLSPIFILLRSAEKSNEDIARILHKMLTQRMKGMEFFVEQLDRLGPLRKGISRQMATEIAWALSSAEMFHLLTIDLGWSREKYVHWLTDAVKATLL